MSLNLIAPGCSEKNGNTNHSSLPISEKKSTKKVNSCKKWCFTFNNYSPNHIDLLQKVLIPITIKGVFQPEVGENGTPHLQGAIWLKTKQRWSEFKLPKEIHWEPMRNELASEAYCQKSQTSIGEPIMWGFPKPKKPLKTISNLYNWQKSIEDDLKTIPNERTIKWLYDPNGNIGKTSFVKYLVSILPNKIIIATAGNSKDIACLLTKTIEKNPDFDINDDISFIMNLPKNTTADDISYTMLESVKDGLITNLKYETGTLVFNNPHIWVFANCLPNNTINGRIITYCINNNTLTTYSPEPNPLDANLSF